MLRTFLVLTLLAQALLLARTGPVPAQAGLAGVVRNGSGQPLRGAQIRVTDARGGPAITVRSDQNGQFVVSVAEGGASRLRVSKAGYALRELETSPSRDAFVDIMLEKGAAISGRVVDELGEPVPAVRVHARAVAADSDAGGAASTDDLGEYRIGSLPAGRYEVTLSAAVPLLLRVGEQRGGIAVSARPASARGNEPPVASVDLAAGDAARVDIVRPPTAAAGAAPFAAGVSTSGPRRSRDPSDSMGTMSGRVFAPGLRPLTDAVVELVSATGWPNRQLAAFTPDGGYTFDFVPPGTYRVVASSPGFTTGMYGEQRSRGGEWIQIAGGDRVDGLDIVLQRGAAVTGTVVDEYGEPLEGMSVQVWKAETRNGRVELLASAAPWCVTDDLGRYRAYGLQPGTYYVGVSERSDSAEPATAGLRVFAPGTGRQLSVFSAASALPVPAPAERTVFYPGRPAVREAVPVVVSAGQVATGLIVEFAPPPAARVTGVALTPTGEPYRGSVQLNVSRRSGAPLAPPRRVTTDADGSFEFANVPPGDYVLQANGRAGGLTVTHERLSITSLEESDAFGAMPLVVGDGDVGPVTLHTLPGSALSGRLVMEGPGPRPAASAFSLDAVTADPDFGRSGGRVRVQADGSFGAEQLVGPMRFVTATAPAGWWLKSVTVGGINAADQPVTFGGPQESARNVEVVFSSVPTGISGRVLDRDRETATGATVVAFSADPLQWHQGSRHLKRSIAIDGRFTVDALPPGNYYVVAADWIDPERWQDVEVLQQLTPLARFVTIREGQPVNVDLNLVRLP